MAQAIRTLYVISGAQRGGAELATLSFIRRHQPESVAPIVLFLGAHPLASEMRDEGFEVLELPKHPRLSRPWSLLRAIGQVKQVIRDQKIDLVHSVMSFSHLVAGPAAAAESVANVVYQHGPIGSSLDRFASRVPTNLVITNSQDGALRLDLLGCRAPVEVCAPGLDHLPTTDQLDLWRANGSWVNRWPEHAVRLLVLGRVDPNKGLDVLLDALDHQEFKGAIGDQAWHLLAAGDIDDSAYGREMRQRLADHPHAESVGFVKEPMPLLASCDVLLQGSFDEAFGLAVREAMACDCAVVATAVGGLPEVIEDGVNGLLVKAGDVEGIARTLSRAVKDKALRVRLGERAGATVRKMHDPEAATQSIEALYRRALGRRR